MQRKYLGDSYDLVKRFFAQSLRHVAPMFAHPTFVHSDIRAEYESITTMPILNSGRDGKFGLLLDPDTGIPLRTTVGDRASRSHAPLAFIVGEYKRLGPEYLICFDQSHHRGHALNKSEQRESKIKYLRERGLSCFYYVSHAPFLFASRDRETLNSVRARLVSLGVPISRFESNQDIRGTEVATPISGMEPART
jgi:hypothetical protein